jgi:hypothetical protein
MPKLPVKPIAKKTPTSKKTPVKADTSAKSKALTAKTLSKTKEVKTSVAQEKDTAKVLKADELMG